MAFEIDRDTARQTIRARWREIAPNYLQPAKKKGQFICPMCGHGANGDGLTHNPKSKDGNGLKCFGGGCNWSGDIIDLIQIVQGVDYNTALKTAAADIGISIAPNRSSAAADFNDYNIHDLPLEPLKEAPKRPQQAQEGPKTGINAAAEEIPRKAPKAPEKAQEATPQADYTAYYKECMERLEDPAAVSYLTARGISLDTARRYWVGFDPIADPASAPGATGNDYRPHRAPRLILPVSRSFYVGRRTDGGDKFKFSNSTGTVGLFNLKALHDPNNRTVFVSESYLDALSIIQVGAAAVGLNSANNSDRFIKYLEENPTDATIIIYLDNDKQGRDAAQKIRDGLKRLQILFTTCNDYLFPECKDANEALVKDPEGFKTGIRNEQKAAEAITHPEGVSNYIDFFMGDDIKNFRSDIKTGYVNLDRISGGLYPGLYAVGAISSLGKTTFCHQLADQIAAAGHHVLFFSMEMSRLEMVSKSISRITAQKDRANAVTSLSIRKGYLPQIVTESAQEYKRQVGNRMNIIEGNFNCDVDYIQRYIGRYMEKHNCKPVVFIDYLQILRPAPPQGAETKYHSQNTKEIIDNAVTELKRTSRARGITIFIISSVNRANYLTPIDFESFKESGGIEFTCDCVWGLQLACLEEDLFNKQNAIKEKRERVNEAKAENPREVELVCLKNRYGVSTYKCSFDYYCSMDLFEEKAPEFKAKAQKASKFEDRRPQ